MANTLLSVAGIPTGRTTVAHIRRDTDEHIYNPNTTSFVEFNNSAFNAGTYDISLTEQGGGYYVGEFPETIESAGTYNVLFYTVAGATRTWEAATSIKWLVEDDVSSSPSGLGWITLNEYKLIKGIGTTDEDTKIEAAINYASAAGNKYLKVPTIKSATYSETSMGRGFTYVYCRNTPVTALTSVTADYDTTDPVVIDGGEFTFNSSTGRAQFKRTSNYLRRLNGVVKTDYTAGYTTVPEDLKFAAVLMTEQVLFNSTDDKYITGQTVDKVSTSFTRLDDGLDPVTSQAKVILDNYRRKEFVR